MDRKLPLMSALGQKQTCATHKRMSAWCQKRTSTRSRGGDTVSQNNDHDLIWVRSRTM